MKQVCKCHGVSGSCSIKVCWRVLPSFRVVGDELARRFSHAARLAEPRDRVRERVRRLERIVMLAQSRRRHTQDLEYQAADVSRSQSTSHAMTARPFKDRLVFVERSPNFCRASSRRGTPGTRGRACRVHNSTTSTRPTTSSDRENSCEHLCCGRGHYARLSQTEEDCECEFQWCCSVKCKKCTRTVVEYFCN